MAGPVSMLRRVLPYLAVAIGIAALYDGWIFYSRWNDARQAENVRQEKEAEAARRSVELAGGSGLKIMAFYASPAVIRRGEHANLCYGVNGAKTVRMEPKLEDLHPSLSYCVQASPAKDTEYKLIAEDAAGHTATADVVLKVAR